MRYREKYERWAFAALVLVPLGLWLGGTGVELISMEHRNPVVLGKQVSELLRRGMLAYAERDEVAGLTGENWLNWLDRGMPLPYFHTEGGRSLLQLPYRDPQDDCSDIDVDALLSAVRMRLRVPLEESA